jgi:hypothetical protein
MGGQGIRASDRDRETAIARLRAALLEGRLETDELERRVSAAQGAATQDALDALVADLPAPAPAAVGLTSGTPRWPGRRAFAERKLLDAPIEEVREATLAFVVPPLERHGYLLREERDDVLTFARRDPRHVGADRVVVRLRDTGDRRTLVMAHGTAPLRIRRAFARLAD